MIPVSIPGFTDPVSSASHLLMAGVSLVGAFFLCRKGRGNGARVFALILYSFSLVFLFSMSGVFHLLDRGGEAREVLQRLDHAGIWVLIAGTITPLQVILFRGAFRWGMLLFVWVLTINGLVLEIVFFKDFPEWLLLSFFLGLGWLGAISMIQFRKAFTGASITPVALGGIFYSVGAIIDFINWPTLLEGIVGPHEIFHIFVVLGAAAHWIFIYRWCHHPIGNEIRFDVHVFPDGKVHAHAIGDSLDIDAESIAELKRIVMDRVSEKFHASIKPMVRLRYFNEEYL
jgi:channel protein (hemolysin III family)